MCTLHFNESIPSQRSDVSAHNPSNHPLNHPSIPTAGRTTLHSTHPPPNAPTPFTHLPSSSPPSPQPPTPSVHAPPQPHHPSSGSTTPPSSTNIESAFPSIQFHFRQLPHSHPPNPCRRMVDSAKKQAHTCRHDVADRSSYFRAQMNAALEGGVPRAKGS